MEYCKRVLDENDLNRIQEIANSTWGGHDHLPLMFREWLANQDCHAIGIEKQSKLVALGCVRIIEDGKTAWLEGLRVHQDHHGEGYAREITDLLYTEARKLGAKRTRLTTSLNSPIPNHLATSIGMNCLYTLDVRWFGDLNTFPSIESSSVTMECTLEEFIENGNSTSNLIPQGAMIYHWYALDIDTPAIRKLGELDTSKFWISHSDEIVDGIGFGYQRTDGNTKEWCTTIYPSTRDALLSILSKQISFCRDENIQYMMLQYPEEFREGLLECVDFSEVEHHNIILALYEGRL